MRKPTDLEHYAVLEYPDGEIFIDTQDDSKGCSNECENCKVCFYHGEQWEEKELVLETPQKARN
jgi:hypothetical protein